MIAQITGKVVGIEAGAVIIDVSGIGYRVFVNNINQTLLDTEIVLYTHFAVRESSQDLYGFATQDEREMFEKLLTIPKVGPKSAMQVMSQADLELLINAIQNNDAQYLTKLSGIGKKTAEKIVVELKDKIEFGPGFGTTTTSADGDVIDALVSLGYPHKAVRDAVNQIPTEMEDTNARIKEALRLLTS